MFGVEMVGRGLLVVVEGVALFLAASTLFDVVHYVLHQFLKSRSGLLRRVGRCTRRIMIFTRMPAPVRRPICPGQPDLPRHPRVLGNQVMFTLPGYFLVGPWPVAVALAIETFIFAMVLIRGGMDEHHIEIGQARPPPQSRRRRVRHGRLPRAASHPPGSILQLVRHGLRPPDGHRLPDRRASGGPDRSLGRLRLGDGPACWRRKGRRSRP